MSRVTFYFVACLMALATVACMKRKQSLPVFQTNISAKCRSRGPYDGACLSQNIVNGKLNCLTLMCAHPRPNNLYNAIDTGAVDNGTPCGPDEICSNGHCVPVGSSSRIHSYEDWTILAGLTISETFTCITPREPIPAPYLGQPLEFHPPAPKRRI